MPRRMRLNAKDTPMPYHPNLWGTHRPTARTISALDARICSSILTPKPDPMPRIPIIMPQLGESIAEATIVSLPFKLGDSWKAIRTCSTWRRTRRPWA